MLFCLTPNVKAQYNLQLDSVIADVWVGTMSYSTTLQAKTYTVPSGKVWKVSSAFSKTSKSLAYNVQILMYIKDPSGEEIALMELDNPNGYYGVRNNIKEAVGSFGGYGNNETGLIWLSAGSQIVLKASGTSGAYSSFISILQFSTQ